MQAKQIRPARKRRRGLKPLRFQCNPESPSSSRPPLSPPCQGGENGRSFPVEDGGRCSPPLEKGGPGGVSVRACIPAAAPPICKAPPRTAAAEWSASRSPTVRLEREYSA